MKSISPTTSVRRSAVLTVLTICLCGQLAICHAFAQSDSTATAPDSNAAAPGTLRVSPFDKDRTDLAVDKAIGFLISKQRKDGAIVDGSNDTTMTALSIMAMASVGIQPGDPGRGRPSDARGLGLRLAATIARTTKATSAAKTARGCTGTASSR